jgi:hypothetical protein
MKKLMMLFAFLAFGFSTLAQDYGVMYTVAAPTSKIQFNIGAKNLIYVTSTKGLYNCLKQVNAGTLVSTAIADQTQLYPIGATVAATASITTLGVTGTATIGNIIAGASTFGSTVAVTGKQTMAAVAPLKFTSTAMTNGLDFTGTQLGASQEYAAINYGAWTTPIYVVGHTAHYVPFQVNLHVSSSAAKDVAGMRIRVDADNDTACTLTPIQGIELRSAMKGAAIGAHTLGGFSTSVDAATTCTGDFLAGYFNIQGSGNITSSNHVNVLESTMTGTGTGVVNVGHFTMNGTGATITNVLKAENILGTSTSLLDLTRTAGTVTNGIRFSGAMTQEIKLRNDETISNATNGKIDFGGYTNQSITDTTGLGIPANRGVVIYNAASTKHYGYNGSWNALY